MASKKKEEKGEEKLEKKEEKKIEEEKDQKIKELIETLQRLQAEFENYKKRIEKENAIYKDYAEIQLVKHILPVLDSFELALQSNTNDAERLKKGTEILYAQLYSTLSQAGLKPIRALGEKFDPYRHEVLMKVDSEKEGIVLEEFQKGYTFKDVIIRHSKVKVGKREEKKDRKEEKGKEEEEEKLEKEEKEEKKEGEHAHIKTNT